MNGGIPRLFHRITRELAHLSAVRERLLGENREITADWVRARAEDPVFIDRLNSFGMQVGRTSESVTKKLLPRLLDYAGESVGSVIDNLNTAHKVGWIEDPGAWAELNRVRNTLVHEYLEDPEFMAAQIEAAAPLVDVVATDFSRLRTWTAQHMDLAGAG
ncbi:MAG: hypothetical protein WEC99_04045 [Halofilum sp. (in: g-proteobacteria)]